MLLPSSATFAADETFRSSNGIFYYNPDACSTADSDSLSTNTGSGSIASYKNPIISSNAPDPSVIRGDDGKFYLFATGFQQFSSDDMVHWKKLNDGISWIKNDPGWSDNRWAPDIAKVGDTYVLAISGRSSGNRTIGYATSKSAAGPFTYQGQLLKASDRGAFGMGFDIDPNIVQTDKGIFAYYGSGRGYIKMAKLTQSGDKLSAGKAKTVFTTKYGEGPVKAEGAYVHKHGEYYYLYFSSGNWEKTGGEPYRLRVARSKSPDSGFVEKKQPILQGNSSFSRPGHNSVITDASGDDFLVYHAYPSGKSYRATLIDKITYENDWPVINSGKGPSSSKQEGSTGDGSTSDTSSDSTVSVFGDSLTVGMKNEGGLNDKLTKAGWNVQTIEAKGGENIAWARDRLKNANVKKSISKSDAVIVAMGTNSDTNPKNQVDGIVKDLRNLNPDINIYWVNIFAPKSNSYRDSMNTILSSKSSSLGFTVVDWYSEAKSKMSYYKFSSDNLHHTNLGYKRKANFVVKNILKIAEDKDSTNGNISNSEPSPNTAVCCSENKNTLAVNIQLAGRDNAEKVFNFLTSTSIKTNGNKPLNPIQAAAFVGNFAQESGIDPKSVNSIGATGIAQWLGGRRDALKKLSNPMTLETQLQFVKTEIEGGESAIMSHSDFKNAGNIEAATVAVRKTYERPGEAEANDTNRINQAKSALADFGGGTPTETGTTDPVASSSSCESSAGEDIGPGSGDFTDSGEINGWSIVSANATLTDKEFGTSMVQSGKCAAIVARVFGASGYGNWSNSRWSTYNPYAVSMWYQLYKTNKAHVDRSPKKGSWLYYEHQPESKTGPKDAGHVVIYLGNNKVLNDGHIENADYAEKSWGLKYLGWIDPTEAGFTAKTRTASELHSLMDGYKKK